jgi:energy-coupling factor transporter ATP-binding protein EcfA2
MKLRRLIIHNFRSLKDVDVKVGDYCLLVGKNNSGKSTVITALRMFYEDGVKYADKIDFPKFATDDHESWIELHFETTTDEQDGLKSEYKSEDNILKVRKYFASENGFVQAGQSNIYGYENGFLSQNMFYGAKNISQSKLGRLIYIPEISKTDDTLKLSGPSPFREMINFVMKKVISNSDSYSTLRTAFEGFNDTFKDEATKDGFSLTALVDDINREIETWKIKFGVEINHICLLYTSPSPRDRTRSRMPSSA